MDLIFYFLNVAISFRIPSTPKNDLMAMKLSKNAAITAINRDSPVSLRNSTTHFANINSSKSVWWFDISVEKFTSEKYTTLDILVFDNETNELHYLRVPTQYIGENLQKFHVRSDQNSVSLELSSERSNRFQDIRPKSARMPFAQFFVKTISL